MAKAVGFEGANTIFQAPEGTDPEDCYDLECFTAPGKIISCWRLNAEELAEVAKTGVVWVEVQGNSTPPILVSGNARVVVGGRPSQAEPTMPRAPREAPDRDKGPETPQSA